MELLSSKAKKDEHSVALPKQLADLVGDPAAPSQPGSSLVNEVHPDMLDQKYNARIPGSSFLELSDGNNDVKLSEKNDWELFELKHRKFLEIVDEKHSDQKSDSKYEQSNQRDGAHNNDKTSEEKSSFWTDQQMERLFHCKIVLKDTVRKLRCKQCGVYRPSVKKLALHKLTHGQCIGRRKKSKPPSQYICDLCKRWFVRKKHLINHLTIKKGQHTCNHCYRSYSCVTQLNNHYIRCGRAKPFLCRQCKACFVYACTLRDHMVVHTKKQPYMCDVCGKTYAWKYDCERHKRLHSEDNPFYCKSCNKYFINNSERMRHMSTVHCKEKRVICDYCEQRFSCKRHVMLHIRNQHIPRVRQHFQCQLCDKRYSLKFSLKCHMQLQHGERSPNQSFKCRICKTVYTHRWSLNNCLKHHKKSKKTKADFQCEICNKKLSSKTILEKHLVVHTREKAFQCEVCGRRFAWKQDMIKHSKGHDEDYTAQFKCNTCGKRCLDNSRLQTHMLTHSDDKPFECDQCGKRVKTKYILARHKNFVHLGLKRFACPQCDKSYFRNCEMQDHIAAVHSDNPVPLIEIIARKKLQSRYRL